MSSTLQSEAAALRKAYVRLIPLLFVLYVVSFLDRINIAFAALTMNRSLGLTLTAFGLAKMVFYVGYILFEVPSNLLLVRFGARRWLARILVTWGFASAASALAVGPYSLYGIRLLVGIAEAGFLPGVLLYLTYWFPPSHRGRATALFFLAQPITIALASPVSGLILRGMDGLGGLDGWRWLFLVEGLPAVVLGVVTYLFLPEAPGRARWLSPEEATAHVARIEREQEAQAALETRTHHSVWAELRSRNVLLLCLAYFGLVVSLTTNSTWTPQIMSAALGGSTDYVLIGLLTAIPALAAVVLMPLWSRWSDGHPDRTWFVVLPMALAGLGWVLVATSSSAEIRVLGLCFASMGALTAMTIFWTLPATFLSRRGRAAGTALISAAGICGSAISPAVFGYLRDVTASYAVGLWGATVLLAVAIATIFTLPRIVARAPAPSAQQAT